MNTTPSPIGSGLGFLRHVGFWIVVPVAVYVAYIAVDAAFWPDRARLAGLAARLPFVVGQIVPVAVFVATTGRFGLFRGGGHAGSRVRLWICVAILAGAAYAMTALVDPLLAPFTGSDAQFPRTLAHAVDAAREAARTTTGQGSEAHLSVAGGYLMQLVVPFTTAAAVLVAAGLGSLVNLGIAGPPSGSGAAAEFGVAGYADELLQESWVRIYRKRAGFSGRGSFVGWALAVSRNVCRMSLRGGTGTVQVSLHEHGDVPDAADGPAAQLARRRRAKALYEALERLTSREREAIVLRLLEERRPAEVAELMGIKEVSVRSLVHRGLKKLRRMKSLKRTITESEGLP